MEDKNTTMRMEALVFVNAALRSHRASGSEVLALAEALKQPVIKVRSAGEFAS
jgi:hypothetical protein